MRKAGNMEEVFFNNPAQEMREVSWEIKEDWLGKKLGPRSCCLTVYNILTKHLAHRLESRLYYRALVTSTAIKIIRFRAQSLTITEKCNQYSPRVHCSVIIKLIPFNRDVLRYIVPICNLELFTNSHALCYAIILIQRNL